MINTSHSIAPIIYSFFVIPAQAGIHIFWNP